MTLTAPKIYHLHPLAAGPLPEWPAHFQHIRGMGFDHVAIAPMFLPGEDGDIFVTANHERLHPALQWNGSADEGFSQLTSTARQHGLRVLLDITLGQVSGEAELRRREPGWFTTGFCGGPPDPRRAHRLGVALTRFQQTEAAEGLTGWWADRLTRLLAAGVSGFRFLEPHHVPAAVWRRVIIRLREVSADCLLLAWTPGVDRAAVARMEGLAFDRTCASTAWWDGRAPWLAEEIEAIRRLAPPLASPEPSFTERLAAQLPAGPDIASVYRHALNVAASVGCGLFVPMGFEYATRRPFDPAHTQAADFHSGRSE
ncbi:MAG: DUF3416 domain-containing protein, partial [Acetobacteraceae bacterium]|nr:DUF3416 domain-containing protein [Acetobacteraceae bacterium]